MAKYVRLWSQDTKVGSGYRNFFVLVEGRKWVTLLYVPTLTKIKVKLADFERHSDPAEFKPRRMIKMLREHMKTFKKYGVGYPKKDVEALIKELSS